jgi:hypothetical protein
MGLATIDQGIALFARENGWEELHHARVGRDAGERLAIGVAPWPQDEALGLDHRGLGGRASSE